MPHPYTQLIVVNVILGFLLSTTVLGAPPLAAAIGAIGAGGLLYLGSRRRRSTRHKSQVQALTLRQVAVETAAVPADRAHRAPK